MKRLFILFVVVTSILAVGCRKDDPQLGDPPAPEDAQFTFEQAPESDNIIVFRASNSNILAKWDLGNGMQAEGSEVRGIYPQAGEYTVVLTVFNSGGSLSSSQTVTISEDDPTLLDNPIYTFLTGGSAIGSKTWVIDSNLDAHFGVGPNPSGASGDFPEWWAAPCNDKVGAGMYDDRYVFRLNAFKFDMVTNGNVYVNTEHIGGFPGAVETNVGDFIAPFENRLDESWSVTIDEDTTLTFTGDAFIGYYTGVQTYKIVRISENELFLRYVDAANAELAWYIRLIPEGYDSGNDCDPGGGGGGGGGTGYSLPIDFESVEPSFTSFGGSTDTIIDNPHPGGINTSSRVLETVHGVETWAGLFVDLEQSLDFSTNSNIAVKLFAPSIGTLRIKLESQANSNVFVEKDVDITTANEWVELSIDFSGEANNTYNRLVLFPGWGVSNAGTFYLDDIEQK